VPLVAVPHNLQDRHCWATRRHAIVCDVVHAHWRAVTKGVRNLI
jgi:hypothetical protein